MIESLSMPVTQLVSLFQQASRDVTKKGLRAHSRRKILSTF